MLCGNASGRVEGTTVPLPLLEAEKILKTFQSCTTESILTGCTTESILTGCITAWYGNCKATDPEGSTEGGELGHQYIKLLTTHTPFEILVRWREAKLVKRLSLSEVVEFVSHMELRVPADPLLPLVTSQGH